MPIYKYKPAAVRAVGAAIGANPVLLTVPCHRVTGEWLFNWLSGRIK